METLLFIPPTAVASLPSVIKKKSSVIPWAIGSAVLAAIIAIFLVAPSSPKPNSLRQPVPANLKPVVGAFGWKLGDRFPGHGENYKFRPETVMLPFDNFEIQMTEDGRIYCVKAEGYAPDHGADPYACKNAAISLLTEKYGLRHHDPNVHDGKTDRYEFGTDDRSARLEIFNDNLFTLEYCDAELRTVYYREQDAMKAKDEADKKAALKKGL
jgi:hypothetical protein